MQKNTKTVNLSLQVVPLNQTDSYAIIDQAIQTIAASGVKHRVQPFSTVMEGTLEELWPLLLKVKEAAEQAGGNELLLNIQVHSHKTSDVHFEQKTGELRPLVVIPARYASTRFPGKPLVRLGTKPVIQHVWEQALKSDPGIGVIIATDDERIAAEARRFGALVELTDPEHASGTDRCAEVADRHPEFDLVVNVQGDEPFIRPEQIRSVVDMLKEQRFPIATLAKPISTVEDLENPNVVKVVFGLQHQAVYFSRHPVPFLREDRRESWAQSNAHYRHLGIYGFRRETLLEISQLPPSHLEQHEKLEQLRWLDNGYRIGVGTTDWAGPGIDTPEDLQVAEALLNTTTGDDIQS